jgi:hypothetical protein
MPQNVWGRRQTASFRRRVPGDIGLFLGARRLKEHWPQMGPVDRRPVSARIIAQIQSGRTGDVHGLGQLGAAHDLLGSIPIGRRQDDLATGMSAASTRQISNFAPRVEGSEQDRSKRSKLLQARHPHIV